MNFSQYELVFGKKPKVLLNLETLPDIKVVGTFRDFCDLLNKKLEYLHKFYKILN